MSFETFMFVLASGMLLGGLYALMATGLAVVWTTLGVFNFAHGTFVALGAYVAWQVSQGVTGSAGFLLGALISIVIMFGVGFVLHYVLVKPFERNANLVLLAVITTLAAASIIENGILLVWGARDKQITPPFEGTIGLLGAGISAYDFAILAVALAVLLVLALFLRRTRTGRAMRAVAQNREAAELMGLNVSRLFAMTIGLSAATAALAGVFIGSVRFISPTFGADPLMKSLIVVILGGVARFSSPILAAFIVGIAESFSVYFLGLYWAPAVLFAMMIAVLLIKPEGLFGYRSKTLQAERAETMKYAPPFQRTNGFLPVLAAFVVLALLPFVFTETYVRHTLILVFIYAILASNWDISLGLGGIVNFAHLAFFAIGLYSFGILGKIVGLDPWIALLLSPVLAVVVAALLAIPILRLEGIYVILVTIAAAQLLLQIVVSQSDYTGGTSGMVLLPRLTIGDYRLSSDGRIGYYYLALLLLTVSTLFLYKLQRSSLGRAIRALRDNKYYAIARGVSEGRMRLYTLCASALFPGLAGGFYGAYLRVASPDVFGLGFLTITLSILILGGVSTIWGPLIAAFVITMLAQLLGDYGSWRSIIIALVIIAVVVIYPGGLFAALQEGWGLFNRFRTNRMASYRRRMGASDRKAATGTADRLVATRHGNVSVSLAGEGEQTILFIHGNSSCKEVFRHQFSEFKGDHRVVAFDLPGHGVSPNGDPEEDYSVEAFAEIVHDLVERLDLGKPVIFGWSLGGYVALEYAARGYPLTALAICGTSPVGKFPEDMPRGYIATPHMELAGKRFHSPYEKARYATHTIGLPRGAEPLVWEAVWRTDGLAREQVFAKLKTCDWPRQVRMLREGTVPFAMINGPGDPFINHDYCRTFGYGNIWGGAPRNVSEAGHAPFLEDPETFNSMMRDFLAWAETR